MKKALQVRLIVFITATVCFLVSAAYAQQSGKKEHTFRGKVEKVDVEKKIVTVNGENIEGWMAAMTMNYGVDKEDVLKNIKPGDQIIAKVYDGDFKVLHDVKVVPPSGPKSSDQTGSKPPAKK